MNTITISITTEFRENGGERGENTKSMSGRRGKDKVDKDDVKEGEMNAYLTLHSTLPNVKSIPVGKRYEQ